VAEPRPTSHSNTRPTTRVDADTASQNAKRPAQPNPFQFTLVCTRRVVPAIVAPGATTGAFWETTSPVIVAPLRSTTGPLKTTTSPATRPEMVTGASKAVSDPLTVPSTVDEPWKTTRSPTCWPRGTSAGPDKTTNASPPPWTSCAHAGVARPSRDRDNSTTVSNRRISTPVLTHRCGWSRSRRGAARPEGGGAT
jgi:hypothetical protein